MEEQGMALREISSRIFFIEGENRGRYPDCHSLLIRDDISAIIDPACREELMRGVASENCVDIVLNTHYHEDHRIYNYCFEDAKLMVHQLDAHGYGSIDHFMSGFSVVNSPVLKEIWHAFLLETCRYRPYVVDDTFADGFEINLGHTTLKVIHTPGHSAGHCCFFFPREELIYLGDIDLTSFGPWYASNNSDIDDFLRSIEKVRELSPRMVVTSHGEGLVTENVDEHLAQYAHIVHRRDEMILDFLTQPHNLEEILALEVIYRRNQKAPDAFFYWDDRWMIEEHLKRLQRTGRIMQDGKKFSSLPQ
jgi:glyoxylase-like metal-dependent hydrolase (beta-lactamase superfamily II)